MADDNCFGKPEVNPAALRAETRFPLDGYNISKVSDKTLIGLFDTAPVLHSFGGTRIVRLSKALILKGGVNTRPCEADILKLVGEKSPSLPVPRVHRVLDVKTGGDLPFGCQCLIVMDFVEGRVVQDCWDSLNEVERVDVVNQTASTLNTLHLIPVPQDPGPVGCKICLARGCWFSDIGGGPFNSKKDLDDWFNWKLTVCQHFKQAPATLPPFCFDKLVLTHQDIDPLNLILAPDGKVWLIDWGNAGIYPEGFDAARLSAKRHATPVFVDMLLERIPRHEDLTKRLKWITYALTTGMFI